MFSHDRLASKCNSSEAPRQARLFVADKACRHSTPHPALATRVGTAGPAVMLIGIAHPQKDDPTGGWLQRLLVWRERVAR